MSSLYPASVKDTNPSRYCATDTISDTSRHPTAMYYTLKVATLCIACSITSLKAATVPQPTGAAAQEADTQTIDTTAPGTTLIDTGLDVSALRQPVVIYRGVDATAFAFVHDNRLYFRNPYPDNSQPFTLRVFDEYSRQIHFQASYKKINGAFSPSKLITERAKQSELIDDQATVANDLSTLDNTKVSRERTFDRTVSGQLNLSSLNTVEDSSEFEQQVSTQNTASDLLASFGTSADYRSISARLDVEAVHRSDDNSTVRINGPRADLSRFQSSLQHTSTDGSRFYITAGDIEVTSANSLVNSGMASRGFSLGFATAGEKFQWEVGRVFGQDIVGAVQGPIGFSQDSYRIGAKAGLRLIDTEKLRLTGRLSVLNVKRSAGEGFAVAETQSGEVNKVWGAGADIEVLNNRLNLSLNWAHSEYDNPLELNADNLPDEPELEVFNPGVTRGRAYRHSIQWQAWQSNDYRKSVSIEASTERAEPFYRSVHGNSTADRRQWSLFTDLTTDSWNVRIGTTQYQNNLDQLITIHTLDEAIHSADISINLKQPYSEQTSDATAHVFVPTSVGIRATVETLRTLNGDQIILAPVIEGFDFMNQVTETLGLSLNWETFNSNTSLSIDHSFFDNRQRERANADSRSLAASISHSIFKDSWNFSGRLGLSINDDLDAASRSTSELVEWGLSGSYATASGAILSAAVDRSIDNFNDLVFDDRERSRSLSYNVSLDAGIWLARRLGWRTEPSVTIAWQQITSNNRSVFFSSDQSSQSLTVNVGVPF